MSERLLYIFHSAFSTRLLTLGASGSGRASARRRTGDVDHRHLLALVVPAVKSLDAGDLDLVEAEEARNVDRGRFRGLPDLRRGVIALVGGLDSDDFSLAIV